MHRLTAVISLFLTLYPINAQEPPFFKSSEKNEKFEAGIPFFAGMAGPVYNPEMGLALKGTAAMTFKLKRNNDYLQHSSIILSSEVNTAGSYKLFSDAELHFLDDRFLLMMAFDIRNMEDHYWGTGTEHANSIEQGDLTTSYHRKSFFWHPSLMVRTIKNLYLGISIEGSNFNAENISPLMNEDPDILTYGTKIKSAGLGFMAFYDGRNRLNPIVKGFFVDAEFLNFPKNLSGTNHNPFQQFSFGYRQHIPVIRKGSLINLQLKTVSTFGDVPWNALAVPHQLTGLHEGKYRDRNSAAFIGEYLHFLYKRNTDELSKHGLFYWIGAATVFGEISEAGSIIFSSGGGYLFHYQPNIFLRAEIFFGTENAGFSFGLNEAF